MQLILNSISTKKRKASVRILSAVTFSEMRFLRDSSTRPSSIRWFLTRRNEQGLHLIKCYKTILMPVSWVKTSRCAGEWLNYFRARIMWSWRLTWRWQDFDFSSYSTPKMGQPTHWLLRTFHLCSFLSKATLAVLSLHFSSLDLWGAGRRIAAVGGSRKDKRGQMREKFLGKRKALGGKSQTSDTWCTIHICSPHFAFSQHNNHWFWLQF